MTKNKQRKAQYNPNIAAFSKNEAVTAYDPRTGEPQVERVQGPGTEHSDDVLAFTNNIEIAWSNYKNPRTGNTFSEDAQLLGKQLGKPPKDRDMISQYTWQRKKQLFNVDQLRLEEEQDIENQKRKQLATRNGQLQKGVNPGEEVLQFKYGGKVNTTSKYGKGKINGNQVVDKYFLGAAIGAVGGIVGGLFGANEEKKEAERARREAQRYLEEQKNIKVERGQERHNPYEQQYIETLSNRKYDTVAEENAIRSNQAVLNANVRQSNSLTGGSAAFALMSNLQQQKAISSMHSNANNKNNEYALDLAQGQNLMGMQRQAETIRVDNQYRQDQADKQARIDAAYQNLQGAYGKEATAKANMWRSIGGAVSGFDAGMSALGGGAFDQLIGGGTGKKGSPILGGGGLLGAVGSIFGFDAGGKVTNIPFIPKSYTRPVTGHPHHSRKVLKKV